LGKGKEDRTELKAELLAYAQSRLKLSNFSVLVGLEVENLYDGGAVLGMRVKEHHLQIHNVVHGG
jgi:acyl-coenzyme A thioesterase PaaI-like protein